MAEEVTPAPAFEHAALEADIARLAQEVKLHRERPENRGVAEKDILKKSLQTLTASAPAPAGTAAQASPSGVLPSYMQQASAETKLEVEYLVDMAFHHGLDKAVEKAKVSGPFVLDALHDALTGKLYGELKRRGILQ
jgi:hypothetical protein